MFWANPFILFLFFAQNFTTGISESTVSANIPGNVRFSIPWTSTSFQTSTTSSSIISSDPPVYQTTDVPQGTNTLAPPTSEPTLDVDPVPGSKPFSIGAIAGIAVGASILLLGTAVGAVWYSRSKHRGKRTVKPLVFEDRPDEIPPTKENVLKESLPIQKTETVDPAPTPATQNHGNPSQRNTGRLRSSVGGL